MRLTEAANFSNVKWFAQDPTMEGTQQEPRTSNASARVSPLTPHASPTGAGGPSRLPFLPTCSAPHASFLSLPSWEGLCHGRAAKAGAPSLNLHNIKASLQSGYLFWSKVGKWICSQDTPLSWKINLCVPTAGPLTPTTTLLNLSPRPWARVRFQVAGESWILMQSLWDVCPALACRSKSSEPAWEWREPPGPG